MATNIDKFVEPLTLSTGQVPIGGVISWMNPNPAVINPPPPPGFEYCDGTTVTTVGSPMLGRTKPSMMITPSGGTKCFARGADITVAYGDGVDSVVGGSDSHGHTGTTSSDGAHDHEVLPHAHPISFDGAHKHLRKSPAEGGDSGFELGVADIGPTDTKGNHAHGGNTGATPATTDDPGEFHNHVVTTSVDLVLPTFIELASIVRVI